MDLLFVATWISLMNVRNLDPFFHLHRACALMLLCLGYVKEQSLKGIIEWFDFWLPQ